MELLDDDEAGSSTPRNPPPLTGFGRDRKQIARRIEAGGRAAPTARNDPAPVLPRAAAVW
jgi:hypothetical protein